MAKCAASAILTGNTNPGPLKNKGAKRVHFPGTPIKWLVFQNSLGPPSQKVTHLGIRLECLRESTNTDRNLFQRLQGKTGESRFIAKSVGHALPGAFKTRHTLVVHYPATLLVERSLQLGFNFLAEFAQELAVDHARTFKP